jgi:hypothetical protein
MRMNIIFSWAEVRLYVGNFVCWIFYLQERDKLFVMKDDIINCCTWLSQRKKVLWTDSFRILVYIPFQSSRYHGHRNVYSENHTNTLTTASALGWSTLVKSEEESNSRQKGSWEYSSAVTTTTTIRWILSLASVRLMGHIDSILASRRKWNLSLVALRHHKRLKVSNLLQQPLVCYFKTTNREDTLGRKRQWHRLGLVGVTSKICWYR